MWKWVWRVIGLGLVGFVGLFLYTDYRAGYFNLPEFSETSYAISFKNGFRGIVVNPKVSRPLHVKYFRRLTIANRDRRYIGVPLQVAPWFETVWSFCDTPSDEDRTGVDQLMPDESRNRLVGARLDAICVIEADDARILRGFVYSVPRL